MAYELLSQSKKLNKQGGPNKSEVGGTWKNFSEKNKRKKGPLLLHAQRKTITYTIKNKELKQCHYITSEVP